MEHSFWHSKWQKNEIGFHEPEGNSLLIKYSQHLLGIKPRSARIFIPLCGKTRDIAWFLSQGASVVGAELSEVAVVQLFKELGATPTVSATPLHKIYRTENLIVFVGDIFNLTAKNIGSITGVYDRAALVALPETIRTQYASHIAEITNKAVQLVISFEYDQERMPGPPFSVSEATIATLYGSAYTISRLERSELEGKLKGKVNADNLVFHLNKK